MKNRKLTIALATVAVLGAASLATGSVMLARIATPEKAPATAAGSAAALKNPLPKQSDRQAARHGTSVAKVSEPDIVPTMVSYQSGDSRVVDHGSAPMAAAEQSGSARFAADPGTTTMGQAGSIPGASGRGVEPGAMAGPSSAAMLRPAAAPVAPAGGSSAGAAAERGPAAAQSDSSANPGTSKDSSPTEVAKAASPGPTEVAPPALPDPIEIAKAALPDPVEIAKAALPDLTGHSPAILPSQDLNVPSGGAVKDVPTQAAQPVSEPSTLALIGIAALGLMARRRMRRGY